jgi:hypothetical protein
MAFDDDKEELIEYMDTMYFYFFTFIFTANYNNSLEHKLRISITDERGNNSEFTTTFVR